MMRNVPVFFLMLFVLCACKKTVVTEEPNVLVRVSDEVLRTDEINLPKGISKEDSALYVQDYIRDWAEDALFYQQAERNIADDAEIEKLVNNYRKALIMHEYQQSLVIQKISNEIPEQDLVNYYSKNEQLFKLDYPLIKGLFIKVPIKAPELNKLRRWYKSNTQDAVDHMEKYSIQHAVKYEYFYDRWLPLDDIAEQIPLDEENPEEFLMKNRSVEKKDSEFYYFLNISDLRRKGSQMPYEYARSQVKSMVLNQKQVDFIKQVRKELYERALKSGNVITYSENNQSENKRD